MKLNNNFLLRFEQIPCGFSKPAEYSSQNKVCKSPNILLKTKPVKNKKNKHPIRNIIKKGFYKTFAEIMKYKKIRFTEKQNFPKAKKCRDKELKFIGKSESLPNIFG